MEIQHRGAIALICCILLVFLLLVSDSHSTQEEDRLRNSKNSYKWKLLFKLSTYWEAIKYKLLAMTPFYPLRSFLPSPMPNTDFRGKVEKEERGAVVKSIEEAKETIEMSAKSAANMVTEKLKNTISHKNHPQDEL